MPLQRRLPKRGFTNIFKKTYQVVNVGQLSKMAVTQISPESLIEARVIRKKHVPLKVLGDGDVTKKIEVSAHAFSKSAKEKIEAAGGKAIVL
jgi:large subunit ribosomal protein L15